MADLEKRSELFNVDNHAMVQICPEQFLSRAVQKQHARSVGPSMILDKLDDNTCVIYLSQDFRINSTFNIANWMAYKSPNFNNSNHLLDESIHESRSILSLPYILPNSMEHIDKNILIKY